MLSSRILPLSQKENNGISVVYVMSRDQRTHDNHALIAAQKEALDHKLPLIVLFNLYTSTGQRSREHYSFMLAGLEECAHELKNLNISFILRTGTPQHSIQDVLKETNARSVYFDFNPLTGPRSLAKKVASSFNGSTFVVDTHNIIPVWVASDKQEFAARTMRTKIHKQLEKYLEEPTTLTKHPHAIDQLPQSVSFADAQTIIQSVPACGAVFEFTSGETAAFEHLKDFIENDLSDYALGRNDIAHDQQSNLSPYLHYGQLSSLRVALEALKKAHHPPLLFLEARMAQADTNPSDQDGINGLYEEMIVRKELSDNFCFYNKKYRSIEGLPSWGQKTLDEHKNDQRDFVYTREEWERGETHDETWNASQKQLIKSGKIHGYMRMYWAKKMLEWSESPEEALKIALYLNDKYSIDGGDPNGYVGILWSIGGLHDRPWTERSIFGKIRYMNEAGLKRKFDVVAYQKQWL
jgi:deoxyribodipyrimidine photo-lyase